MTKLIVLDRDGVINQDSDQYIKSVDEFIPLDGSLEAIAELNAAGYTVVVATNQSGIARGYYSESVLDDMHNKLKALLEKYDGKVDKIYFCPHGPGDNCNCRKPLPGMMLDILANYKVQPGSVVAIGDSLRDLQAAHSVGMIPVLVRTGKGKTTEKQVLDVAELKDVQVFDDLRQSVKNLLTT